MPSSPAGGPGGRLVSLDAFRGATILGMILVNNPGTWSAVYPPLLHAEWHGWTPTDLIFPFFLLIVGVAIPLALGRAAERGASRREILGKVARRGAILFALGLFLHAFPFFTLEDGFGLRAGAWEKLRILGVLQRIAICYFVAATLFVIARPRIQHALTAVLLLGYWAAMTLAPVPGYGPGQLDVPEATLSAWIDRAVLGSDHLWAGAARQWDPEGLFSTLPAIATTLIGVAAGRRLRRRPVDRAADARVLATWGAALTVVGWTWGLVFPINKALWTSSYVVFTAGLGLAILALFLWLADVRGHVRWTWPFVVYGVNAITVFVGSGLLGRILLLVEMPSAPEGSVPLQRWIFEHLFAPLASPVNASLLYALTWVVGWFAVLVVLERRGIVIKV